MVSAQGITVNARIDSTTMWIGSQTKLSFEVSQQPNQKVAFPLFSDTIVGGLDIVETLKPDTVKSQDGHVLISHNYVVTAFEDSLLYIPPYPFVVNGDTVWSKSLSLKVVQPFQIDTASHQIADIKPVMNPKMNWKQFFLNMLIVALIFALIVLVYLLVQKLRKRKNAEGENVSKEPALPPYEMALSKLNKLREEKMWQHNRSKEYHTELTEIIREYVNRTFDIPCMEMTSEEILQNLNHLRFENSDAYAKLKQILRLADLVKFAKWHALPDEHELSLKNSFEFIEMTKISESEVTTEEHDIDEEKEN